MVNVLETFKELGGLVGVIALLTCGWQCWYASQFNEIEVLIAGNDWRKKRDLGIASFIFVVFLLCNCAMGISMDINGIYVFIGLTIVFWIIGVICSIISCFKKINNINIVATGTLFSSFIFIGWIFAYLVFTKFLSDGKGGYNADNILIYIGVLALATVIEYLCLLVLIRTIRSKSRVLIRLREYESKDKELFVYRRIGDDLVCGTDADIYSAKDIVIVPAEYIKEKGYSFGFTNADSDEFGKSQEENKKSTTININADSVIVNGSQKTLSVTDSKETVVAEKQHEKKSEDKKDS